MEQALIEVLEEEEIAALKEQQRKFLELRAAETAEARRLEEQERRMREEKVRRAHCPTKKVVVGSLSEYGKCWIGSTIKTIRGCDDGSKGDGRTSRSDHSFNWIYSRTSSSGSRRIENVRVPVGRDQGWFVNTQEHCYFL